MKNLTAKDIMNANVLSVQDDMSIHDLAHFFTENMISGAPVLDKNGKLLGVVSLSDIVRNDERRSEIIKNNHESDYYLHGWEDNMDEEDFQNLHIEDTDGLLVREIMTPLIFKVPESSPISEMADIMIGGRIHRLFVTRDEQVVGVVSSLDMLKAIREFAR